MPSSSRLVVIKSMSYTTHPLLCLTCHFSAGDRTGNVKAGCVVDEAITRPGYPNFYLQSHAAIQGSKLIPFAQFSVYSFHYA